MGDNVGDVAEWAPTLRVLLRFYPGYRRFGAAAFIGSDDTVMQFKAVIAPMLIAAVGILLPSSVFSLSVPKKMQE